MEKTKASTRKINKLQVSPWQRATPLTQEEAEAHLHREGYETFLWYDVPGASYPTHQHDRDECLWILRGEIHFTVDDQTYVLKAGDKMILPAHTTHIVQVPANSGVTYLIGHKKPDDAS